MIQTIRRFFLLALLCQLVMPAHAARPEAVSITEIQAEPGSPEAFLVEVFKLARAQDFEGLKPHYHWTWDRFYGRFDPDYHWKKVINAADLSEIHIMPPVKSDMHEDVYLVRCYIINAEGRRHGFKEIIIKTQDGYQLAVQANGSDVGNLYIKRGFKRDYTDQLFAVVSAKPIDAGENQVRYETPNGDAFIAVFDPETTEMTSLQYEMAGQPVDIYLVVFDLEGTPTIKLKP